MSDPNPINILERLADAVLKEAKRRHARDAGYRYKSDSDQEIWELGYEADRERAVDDVIKDLIAASQGPARP